MRTLWNVVSFLAVVHLLALLIVAAWLWLSHRVDSARLADIRSLLATPVSESEAQAQQTLLEIEAQRVRETQERLRQNPPVDSAAQIQRASLVQLLLLVAGVVLQAALG